MGWAIEVSCKSVGWEAQIWLPHDVPILLLERDKLIVAHDKWYREEIVWSCTIEAVSHQNAHKGSNWAKMPSGFHHGRPTWPETSANKTPSWY